MEIRRNKAIVVWLLSGCSLIFLMVVVGGITRLTNSGLSMVNWNLIMGVVPPLNEEQWLDTFEAYKQFPEYQLKNFHFTLDEFKSIFFWEYFHRLLGRLIGLVFIIPFIYFLIKKRLNKRLIIQSSVLFAMGGLQGAIGWWMVKSGLVKDPDVSHFRLAVHLITAFLTFAFTFWVALEQIYGKHNNAYFPKIKRWINVLSLLVVIQIIYGAFVAGLNAGFIMNTWPKMGQQWIHESTFALTPLWKNFTEGIVGTQFVHRYLAYIIVGLVLYIWLTTAKYKLNEMQVRSVIILLLVVFIQFLLGVFTLLAAVPISLGVLHQVGAFILLGGVTYVSFTFKKV